VTDPVLPGAAPAAGDAGQVGGAGEVGGAGRGGGAGQEVPAAVELIRAKRDGQPLTGAAIRWLIGAYLRGEVAEEQMSALLMAIYFRGLGIAELRAWTAAMIESGERLDLSGVGMPTVDKHSTGGVGDKVSLVLAPLVAACGAAVPQLSGRGLGHTGGTLDKLEAISGWRAALSPAEMLGVLRGAGCVICAAGPGLAPADRRLYALRDVTGTVESIPLIASSIMSKKIAEGTAALVLDVKVGSGAFMPELAGARELAQTMVTLGEEHGVRTAALLTRMDTPLGRAVGNGAEVAEAVATLRGDGPADLVAVVLALAAEMLSLAGVAADPAAALADGRALDRYRAMVSAQGGDPDGALPEAGVVRSIPAVSSGWLQRLEARAVGLAAWRLGAGRARKEDPVSPSAGVICLAKPGDRVEAGQPLLELHTDDEGRLGPAISALDSAIGIGPAQPAQVQPVIERIGMGE
jgi:thymidine phosphorylase